MAETAHLQPGQVWWCWLDPIRGREQGGRRPVVVVASHDYLDVVDHLVIVVPVTTIARAWPNHIPLSGSTAVHGWAMTEQIRTLSRQRLARADGSVDDACLSRIRVWLNDFLSAA
ncbi:MAG TPA: type II toxin-antitoxin system PemK/MazF family toxin [Beutenbergiaceae bacterium]|nr:type II toxin-antitoxin system PemK/MazF family toxin [Beutenbergiaceae bacterium]